MDLAELGAKAGDGSIDTVVLALCDMQGRLQGKRMAAGHFLEEVVGHGAEACNYLLAVDVEMTPADGFALASWEGGYGDFVLSPDLGTLCETPWNPGTALCLSDVQWHDGRPVAPSPRQVLRAQLDRLAERGMEAFAATELEFLVFDDTYEDAWDRGYRGLTPANRYNVDYSLVGTARVEPLLRRIRNDMAAAGLVVENAKGECNLGQHEINFRYGPALQTADQHAVYKTGAKEIASQLGKAVTFMAKFDEREGNSCHIHLSVRRDAETVFEPSFLAGQLATARDLSLLLAPNVNSYKRYADKSFAPVTIAWGEDNRTCGFRVVGHGPSKRIECRIPGADVNPYLALAALIAGGLHGLDQGLELEPAFEGNAYAAAGAARVPHTLREARDLFAESAVARDALGDEVVDHYVNAADVELATFDAAVTDWERVRGFERL
jgi:glutamine synthetase